MNGIMKLIIVNIIVLCVLEAVEGLSHKGCCDTIIVTKSKFDGVYHRGAMLESAAVGSNWVHEGKKHAIWYGRPGWGIGPIEELGASGLKYIPGDYMEADCPYEHEKWKYVKDDGSKEQQDMHMECGKDKSEDDDDVSYGPWSKWGRCTEPCDGGKQIRHRQCSGVKELCEHRIITDERECNSEKCTFPRETADDLKYFLVNEGSCISGLDKDGCQKIATASGKQLLEIVNKDLNFFPQGCYYKVSHKYYFYNTHASTKRCDAERMCMCNMALGRNELVDWVFGKDNVNVDQKSKKREVFEGNSGNARKRDMTEKKAILEANDVEEKDTSIPFELMEQF